MSSVRTETLIYKKKKLSNLALPKCSCIDLCDCQSHLNGAQDANEIKIIGLSPKDPLTSLREAGGLFTTDQSSIPDHLKKYWSQDRTKNAISSSIISSVCVFFFLSVYRTELIWR